MDTVETWTAACMEPAEWVEWVALNPALTRLSDRAERPCADCPASYAAEMRAVGRCNGYPRGVDMSENGVTTMPRPLVNLTGKETTVDLALPCGRCAHAPVCRIKPQLEARLETLPVTLPQLDPAIRVALAATVECSQFLRASGAKPAQRASGGQPGTRSPESRERMRQAQLDIAARKRAEREAAS